MQISYDPYYISHNIIWSMYIHALLISSMFYLYAHIELYVCADCGDTDLADSVTQRVLPAVILHRQTLKDELDNVSKLRGVLHLGRDRQGSCLSWLQRILCLQLSVLVLDSFPEVAVLFSSGTVVNSQLNPWSLRALVFWSRRTETKKKNKKQWGTDNDKIICSYHLLLFIQMFYIMFFRLSTVAKTALLWYLDNDWGMLLFVIQFCDTVCR